LVNGGVATAADAGAPDAQTTGHIAAAIEAGFVAGTFEDFSLKVLEVVLVGLYLFEFLGHAIIVYSLWWMA
jgi:hypothetical protein